MECAYNLGCRRALEGPDHKLALITEQRHSSRHTPLCRPPGIDVQLIQSSERHMVFWLSLSSVNVG